jgi:type VI secretion system protein ImpK
LKKTRAPANQVRRSGNGVGEANNDFPTLTKRAKHQIIIINFRRKKMSSEKPTLTRLPDDHPAEEFHKDRVARHTAQKTLLDLFYDGFLMIFMLRNGHPPQSASLFGEKVKHFIAQVVREAHALKIPDIDISEAKYAFCAAVDEAILYSEFPTKDEWLLSPLQLTLFGDQLAGNNFFVRLDELRSSGPARIQSIEVFYMCLLLGFKGKYIFEGKDKHQYYILKLGQEIARMRGRRPGFAPHAPIPDRVVHALKNDLPIWAIGTALIFLGVMAFLGISFLLGGDTTALLADYQNLIDLGPRSAHLTISLP